MNSVQKLAVQMEYIQKDIKDVKDDIVLIYDRLKVVEGKAGNTALKAWQFIATSFGGALITFIAAVILGK